MIHKNNKSLNDLFRSAEAEADGNVLSQSEVERLLQSAKRSVPVTQSIQQKLFERLLSTPLKIGMTAMTTAACITLGLIAFWPAPQQSTSNITKAPILSHGTYGSQTTDGGTQNFAMTPSGKSSFAISQSNEALPAAAIIPATPIATADSLQPIELTPEQLAQLGIVLEDNGDIDFYTKSGSSGKVIKLGLPPSWGIRLDIGQPIPDSDIDRLTIPKSAPRLVTEPNGAKRLFSFESDTAFTKTDGNHKIKMEMHNEMSVMPSGYDSVQQNPNDEQVTLHMISDSDLSKCMSKMNFGLDTGTVFIDPSNKSNMNADMRISINNDSNNIERLTNAIRNFGNVDSAIHRLEITIDELHDTSAHSDIDARLKVANVQTEQFIKIAKEFGTALHNGNMKRVDSVVSGVSLLNKSISKNIAEANKNIAEADVNLADINQSVKAIEEQANSIQLNHLIPIRVINNKNVEHPNELIFWYEPSPELTAAMPAAVNPVPAPQSKQLAISVYPNPTMGPATIHYELTDAPRAYFSVRNLLGQEVLNGGMTSSTTGDANLDLSKLPAGVYLLITTTDNGERDVERVVVTK